MAFLFWHLMLMIIEQHNQDNIFQMKEQETVIVDGKVFFDQAIKNDLRTYHSIQTITAGQGDDDTSGYLLDYNYKILKNDSNRFK